MTLSDEDFAEIRTEWNEALAKTDGFSRGGLDRTDLMKSVRRVNKGAVTVGEIIGAVAAETGIPAADITGPRQLAKVVRPRRLAMFLACELIPSLTHDQIAGHFNRTSHLVSLALVGVRLLRKKDPAFAHCYQHVRWRLGLA